MNGASNKISHDLVNAIEAWAASMPEAPALILDEETVTFKDLNVRTNRVAIMLPNIPEFVYALAGTLKLGAVAVPFNTLYKGGEILHILKDSCAKVLFALTNFAPMINEIRPELPDLEQVILTGERNLLFAHPDNTAFVQLILPSEAIQDLDACYQTMGNALLQSMHTLGVHQAWYKHRGSIRVRGDKIASFVIAGIESTALINAVVFLGPLETRDFLRVVWVPPEVRDKALEPMTSVEQETGKKPNWHEVKAVVAASMEHAFQMELQEGTMVRDELFGYEKLRSLAYKAR